MDKATLLQEVRLMRFKEIYERRAVHRLTVEEAADLLGVHERTYRRWCSRYEEDGEAGLLDKRIGKASSRAAPLDEVTMMLKLFETYYWDFNAKHFYDKWKNRHNGTRSYTWVKNKLQEHGKIKKAKKKGVHRRKRPRRPLPGMMLHQDGSTHEWVLGSKWDLIVTMDDATSKIYSAFFVEEEGTMSSFRGVKEVIEQHGLFNSMYVDRGAHYWHTPLAGGRVDKTNPTQFHRALKQLGIELIAAYSPEARGRSERTFGTLQERLPKELRLAGITNMQEANQYLKEHYIPEYNRLFAVEPEEEGSAFISWAGPNLKDVLCVQEERTVAKDNTVSYKARKLQIPADKYRHHYIKVRVRVHEYPDGSLAIFHGPRCLVRFDSEQPESEVESITMDEFLATA